MILLRDLIKVTNGKLIQGNLNTKIEKISIDTRILEKGDVFLAIKGEKFDGHKFFKEAVNKGTKGLIVSNKLKAPKNLFILKVKDTTEALGKIAFHLRKKAKIKVIAITGSNGKTTVKEMTAKILGSKFKVLSSQKSYNNKIGIPLTLLNLKPSHQIVVLELGANHLGEIRKLAKICQPNIGIITNISKTHIGYFGSQQKIFKAKTELIRYSNLETLVLNTDDPYLRKIKFKDKITFGIKNSADFRAEILKENPKFLFKY